MKKNLIYGLLFLGSFLVACGGDDKMCLSCEGGETVCEGDVDPDSGTEVTLTQLELAKGLAEGFGASCTLQ